MFVREAVLLGIFKQVEIEFFCVNELLFNFNDLKYLVNIVQWDFGPSLVTRRPVTGELATALKERENCAKPPWPTTRC